MRSRTDRDAFGVDRRDRRAEPHLDAELLERALRGLRKRRIERRQQARRRLDQDDARGARIDRAEVRRQRAVRQLRDGAGHLDAGRAAADDDEIQQPRALVRIRLGLGLLEGEQDAAANVGRVVDGLQPGRGGGPVVVAEIGVLRAGREDQVVERDAAAFGDHHALRDVDAGDLAEHDIHVPRARQDAADRRGDLGRREPGGRDLIEQRLEQVIIVLVDDGDVERAAGERLGGGQAAEAGSDDDDAGVHRGPRWQSSRFIWDAVRLSASWPCGLR